MPTDRREEFEQDYVYAFPDCRNWDKEAMEEDRYNRHGACRYSNVYLDGMYAGWCMAKDAQAMREAK